MNQCNVRACERCAQKGVCIEMETRVREHVQKLESPTQHAPRMELSELLLHSPCRQCGPCSWSARVAPLRAPAVCASGRRQVVVL